MKKVLLVIFLFLTSSNLSADNPYYLNFKYILNESAAGKKAQEQLKSKLDKGIKSIRNKEKSLQEEEKKNIEQKNYLSQRNTKKKLNN